MDDKLAIIQGAEGFVSDKYGYAKLLAHAADWCLGGAYFFRRLCRIDGRPICSYVVAAAYEKAGKNFGVAVGAASPDDIWDFCVSNPDKFQFVWQRGTMYKEPQDADPC